MSIRELLAGYAVTLVLFFTGCTIIGRSTPGLKGLGWIKAASGLACAGVTLALFRSTVPAFFSIVIPHLAIFSALVLIHQAVNDILELNRRYLRLSAAIAAAAYIGLVTFTSVHPAPDWRIYTVDTADALQASLTVFVLFRRRRSGPSSPIRSAGIVMTGIVLIHLLRIVRTIIHPPRIDFMRLDIYQAFFLFFNFTFGLAAVLNLIWLSFYSQRNKLEDLALTDELSGLPNRRAFQETLRRELIYSQIRGTDTGLVLIDLDFFKVVNDRHGHAVGDAVIQLIGSALRKVTRRSDVLARFGGEEFVMMLRNTNLAETSALAERIRQQVESFRGLPADIQITASLGVALSTSSDTPESLLKKTDEALYYSKSSGRNTVSCHLHTDKTLQPETWISCGVLQPAQGESLPAGISSGIKG